MLMPLVRWLHRRPLRSKTDDEEDNGLLTLAILMLFSAMVLTACAALAPLEFDGTDALAVAGISLFLAAFPALAGAVCLRLRTLLRQGALPRVRDRSKARRWRERP